MGFQQFGFGKDDQGVGRKNNKLKMEKNETARVSFLWWPGLDEGKLDLDAGTPYFVGAPRHYMKGVGYFINKGPEYTKIAGEPPKTRIATLIVKWPTRRDGKLDAAAIQAGDFEVMFWVFDEGKYSEIKPIAGEWPLGSHDLKINCSDAQFQKMSFSPARDSILRKFYEKGTDHPLVQQILAAGQALLPKVQDQVGRDMTLDQIREKLAGGGGGGPASSPASTVASGEIDDALDELLD